MNMRNQIIENGVVTLDVTMPSRTDYSALHHLLTANGVSYSPNQFFRRGDWVCFKSDNIIYRAMSARKFG